MKRRALLLVNPQSRRGQEAEEIAIAQLQQLNVDLLIPPRASAKEYPDLIRRHQSEVDWVIVGGGDGSVNAAVDGILDTELPLGILPLGTANNLARTLGIPSDIAQACEIIAQNHTQKIDLGWVNGQYFFNIASLGLSAEVNRRVSKRLKRHWGVLAYIVTAMQVLWTARPFWVDIHWQGRSVETKTVQITIANGRYYGSGLVIADDATIDDQRLDLHSLEINHWWEILPLIPAALRGKTVTGNGVRMIQANDIEIVTRKPYPINTDGEYTTHTPARFRVIPQALSLLVPLPSSGGDR